MSEEGTNANEDRSSVVHTITEEEAEKVIENLKRSSNNMVKYLRYIVQNQAWIPLGYASFRELCKKRLNNLDYSTLSRIRNAIELHDSLESNVDYGDIPEYVYRHLLKVVKQDQQKVWDKAKEQAGEVNAIRSEHILQAIASETAAVKPPQKRATKRAPSKLHEDNYSNIYEYVKSIVAEEVGTTKKGLMDLLEAIANKLEEEGIIT